METYLGSLPRDLQRLLALYLVGFPDQAVFPPSLLPRSPLSKEDYQALIAEVTRATHAAIAYGHLVSSNLFDLLACFWGPQKYPERPINVGRLIQYMTINQLRNYPPHLFMFWEEFGFEKMHQAWLAQLDTWAQLDPTALADYGYGTTSTRAQFQAWVPQQMQVRARELPIEVLLDHTDRFPLPEYICVERKSLVLLRAYNEKNFRLTLRRWVNQSYRLGPDYLPEEILDYYLAFPEELDVRDFLNLVLLHRLDQALRVLVHLTPRHPVTATHLGPLIKLLPVWCLSQPATYQFAVDFIQRDHQNNTRPLSRCLHRAIQRCFRDETLYPAIVPLYRLLFSWDFSADRLYGQIKDIGEVLPHLPDAKELIEMIQELHRQGRIRRTRLIQTVFPE